MSEVIPDPFTSAAAIVADALRAGLAGNVPQGERPSHEERLTKARSLVKLLIASSHPRSVWLPLIDRLREEIALDIAEREGFEPEVRTVLSPETGAARLETLFPWWILAEASQALGLNDPDYVAHLLVAQHEVRALSGVGHARAKGPQT